MASPPSRVRRGESGQAAVEAALTLPLTVFLILGTLQLFMMLQGRIMAEYAAFEAVRAGSRHHGDCVPMVHAGLAALLPNIVPYLGNGTSGGTPAQKLASAWSARIGASNNPNPKFIAMDGSSSGGPIFWLVREQPLASSVPAPEDVNFDAPVNNGGGMRLEVRFIYWFPLKIPFADWVMSRMFLAHFALQDYNFTNPLNPAEKYAGWTAANGPPIRLDSEIANEFRSKVMSGKYVFPIQASYGMRMMTPARKEFFQQQNCAPAPQSL
jgi:hypothetical protein